MPPGLRPTQVDSNTTPETRPPSATGAEGAGDDESARIAKLDKRLEAAAANGMEALKVTWATIAASDKPMLKAALDRRHKPAAEQADAEATR